MGKRSSTALMSLMRESARSFERRRLEQERGAVLDEGARQLLELASARAALAPHEADLARGARSLKASKVDALRG